MVFSSVVFLFYYLPAVLAVYYLIPARSRNLWLFIVNLIFYGWGEPVYILLMLFSICLNYVSGRLIAVYRQEQNNKAKTVLIVNTALNLALLVVFKYADLIIGTFDSVFPISPSRSAFPFTRFRRCPIPLIYIEATPGYRKTLSASALLSLCFLSS